MAPSINKGAMVQEENKCLQLHDENTGRAKWPHNSEDAYLLFLPLTDELLITNYFYL